MSQTAPQEMRTRCMRIRIPFLHAGLSISALAAFAATFIFTHPDLSPELMGPFAAIHGLLASGVIAVAVYAGFSGLMWPLTQLMAGVETAAKAAGTIGIATVLPFAQATDPEGAGAKANGGQAMAAAHEVQIGAYGGYNSTRPSTVRFVQPGGTDLTFKDVQWIGESFKTEPYWGVRTTYWNAKLRGIGFMFDYTHAKATALKTQEMNQSGTRDGKEVPPKEPFSATFRKLEFTHGLNFFTLNAVYRAGGLHRRFAPYAGVGIGLSVPHVDTNRAGAEREKRTYQHQITGLTFQVLGGLQWGFLKSGRASAFAEYKLNHSSNVGELNGGGALTTDLWTNQVPVGVSYHHFLGAR
ncbi:MAG: outer membrane beta-barrel protein [Hyphomicrobiaceae bacterium]|nr:outer membrane beta-barrel protein [Hyphomicrobiaceae bacterium]